MSHPEEVGKVFGDRNYNCKSSESAQLSSAASPSSQIFTEKGNVPL
jgi:hypothetical protein